MLAEMSLLAKILSKGLKARLHLDLLAKLSLIQHRIGSLNLLLKFLGKIKGNYKASKCRPILSRTLFKVIRTLIKVFNKTSGSSKINSNSFLNKTNLSQTS